MTQEDLAKMMGYKSKSTINKIELGINDIPQSKIVQFAEVLGTTPAELMGWNDDENSSPSDKVELTEGEQMWLELYHRLSDDTRKLLIETMDSFDRLPKDKQKLALDMIRVALGDRG
jgi:transcriptional regulator with XRE-family HTH domain